MGLGILEDKVLDHVPGTTRYFDDPSRTQYAIDGEFQHTHLKTATRSSSKPGALPIILVPQPSDDPNDPLNWPLWKRDLITIILSITAIFATSLGPILAANTITLSFWFLKDFTHIAILTGYFLLGTGIAGAIFVPSSRIWGKRHAFIIGICLLIASSVWAGSVGKNYNSFLGARIIQGVGCAPYEALVNAVIGDLYFVHQRGARMAFTNLAVFGGSFFTPIVVGKITHTIHWWWTFYLVAIFCAVCLPLVVFFVPETAYRRDERLNIDMVAVDQNHLGRKEAGLGGGEGYGEERSDGGNHHAVKMSWRQQLMPFNGRKTDESFWKLFLRPFVLFLQPAFLWAALIQGAMIGWTVFIGVFLGAFFLGAPLWWDEVNTGYAYTGAFIGALIGFLIAGLMADSTAKLMTKWNKGIYEPEFRMLLVIPQLIIGCIGVYGFGYGADGLLLGKFGWAIPLMFFGFQVCGMVIGAVASSLYIVDAYRDLAIEGFTCLIIFKNFFSFALTFKAYEWLIQNGTRATPVFKALGTVQLIICLSTIPMYIFGKRIRSFYHRHDLLKIFKLR